MSRRGKQIDKNLLFIVRGRVIIIKTLVIIKRDIDNVLKVGSRKWAEHFSLVSVIGKEIIGDLFVVVEYMLSNHFNLFSILISLLVVIGLLKVWVIIIVFWVVVVIKNRCLVSIKNEFILVGVKVIGCLKFLIFLI